MSLCDSAKKHALPSTALSYNNNIAPADFTALVNEPVALPIGTTLPVGATQFCTPITIIQDNIPENLEMFSVLLTSGTPGIVAVAPNLNTASVNILGDSEQILLSNTIETTLNAQ